MTEVLNSRRSVTAVTITDLNPCATFKLLIGWFSPEYITYGSGVPGETLGERRNYGNV